MKKRIIEGTLRACNAVLSKLLKAYILLDDAEHL
jgi:hypothetical protein